MDLSERPRDVSQLERRHPWELARFRFFRQILVEGELEPRRVLDAGAGDAWFAQQLLALLPAEAAVTCWDAHYTPETVASLRAAASPRARFTKDRPSDRYDLIMLLDVLEHVEHDREFLAALLRENLAANGAVLVSVPAWQELFTSHDTRLRHHRRYRPSAALQLIEQSGLSVVRRGGLFHSLLVPRVVEKARELLVPSQTAAHAAPPSLSWQRGALVTRAIDLALSADNHVSLLASKAGVDLPGLSWWALCRRP